MSPSLSVLAESEKSPKPMRLRFFALGTNVELCAYGKPSVVERCLQAGQAECVRLGKLLSTSAEGSEIKAINEARGRSVPISEETFQLIRTSLSYCERSRDCFDITIGTLTRLWNFRNKTIPSKKKLSKRLGHVNYHVIKLAGAPGDRTICLEDEESIIDLGGIAKGYIADRLSDLFAEFGVQNHLINLGGNIITQGRKPDGSRFVINVENPFDKNTAAAQLEIENVAVATSGPTIRAFVKNGKRYHHILDPKTGMPAESDVESVTIVAASGLACDGFSTTAYALGVDSGRKFVSSTKEIKLAVFIDRNNTTHIVS